MCNELISAIPLELQMFMNGSHIETEIGNSPDHIRMHPFYVNLDRPLDAYRERYFAVAPSIDSSHQTVEPLPFLLVRETGMPFIDRIEEIVEDAGAVVQGSFELSNFEALAPLLYPPRENKPISWQWLALNDILREQGHIGEVVRVLTFQGGVEIQRRNGELLGLKDLKRLIRKEIGIQLYACYYNGKPEALIDLHPVHAPDPNLQVISHELSLITDALRATQS